jgi:Tfp pilus assembly protein PilO
MMTEQEFEAAMEGLERPAQLPSDAEFDALLQVLGRRVTERMVTFRRLNPDITDEQLQGWLLQALNEWRRNALN